uniref:Zgc:113276 n=1 Tax=Cyprinus carpio TaxID=7962 RepID=A0A8C2JZL7_CYPCA
MLDVLIIGGGPHALTLAILLSNPEKPLCHSNADILQGIQLSKTKAKSVRYKNKKRQPISESSTKCLPCPPLHFKVVDSYGKWTSLWESQFTALNIPHLRSHTLVHTDPFNKKALQDFVLEQNREDELNCLPEKIYIQDENAFFNDNRLGKKDKKLLSTTNGLQKNLYFSLPGTQLSIDFFQEQVHKYDLDSVLISATVDRIIPVLTEDESKVKFFKVTLHTGENIEAKAVIMATGPSRAQMANIPCWVQAIQESYPEESLQHTVQLMHYFCTHEKMGESSSGSPPVCQMGQRVMVVGGGLTSAHIIAIALKQGACHVTWVLRKHLQLKQFDIGDIESLIGRYSHVEHGIKMDGLAYLRQFYNERSLHKRLAMIKQARKGGSVTPEAYAQLQPFIQSGQLLIRAHCQVYAQVGCYVSRAINSLVAEAKCGEQWGGEKIWLATGCKLDATQDPLLSDVMTKFPIQVLEGWPCITESLQWTAGCPLYVTGQYAALQVGPHAVNLAGGQAASIRIFKDIISQHRGLDKSTLERMEKTCTEEYISHMHGLMWL